MTLSPLPQGKKLPPNIDEDAEEGDVSDEDSADEMEDDCKLMNGDVCTRSFLSTLLSTGKQTKCQSVYFLFLMLQRPYWVHVNGLL